MHSKSKRLCIIGEVMIEISQWDFPAGTSAIAAAGDTYNTAVHLSRLLRDKGFSVEYVTLLGSDGLSNKIVEQMEVEGISTRLVGRHPSLLPGIYSIELDRNGERSFQYWRSASAARQLFAEEGPKLDELDGADLVFLSLITLAILPSRIRERIFEKLIKLKKCGTFIAFDSNYRPALWPNLDEARYATLRMYCATNLALPSKDDEVNLWQDETVSDTFSRLSDAGVEEIVMKTGPSGPVIWQNHVQVLGGDYSVVDFPVDTTGAGDAFNAGYIAARLGGACPKAAAAEGHNLATNVIGVTGAIPREYSSR